MNILFTSAGRRVELMQAFRKASQDTGIPLTLFGADMNPHAPALAFYRREGFRVAEQRPDGLLTLEKSLGGPEE